MMPVLNESVANGLSKTGLNVKIGQVVPKLWNKCKTVKFLMTFGAPCTSRKQLQQGSIVKGKVASHDDRWPAAMAGSGH